jgi:hypothetical protein
MAEKELCERVATLEEGFKNVCNDIKDIKEKLLGRPSWGVLIIISALTTISTSLAIFVITNR